MATALQVRQAQDSGTYALTASPAAYLTLAGSQLTAGHRYLVFGSCEVKGYGTSLAVAGLSFNGSALTAQTNVVIRGESTQYTTIQFLDRITGTGSGVGLEMGGYWIISSGAEIRNLRIHAIDLDVNATDFPQDSPNGWMWASQETTASLTTSWTTHSSIQFTPDGESDYLFIGMGNLKNINAGTGYVGLHLEGYGLLSTENRYSVVTNAQYTNLVSRVIKPPAAPTTISLQVRSPVAGTVHASKILVLRLDTFTNRAGASSPTVTAASGTGWQQALTVTPSSPGNDEYFLLFGQIQGTNWTSGDASFSKRIVRVSSAVLETQSTADVANTSDLLGPAGMTLDITSGVNPSYALEFARDSYSDRPANFYSATLVALKLEVGYVAPTKVYLPVLTNQSDTTSVLTGVWVDYLTIPGYRFVLGHRYAVMAYCEVKSPSTGVAEVKLQFNGADIATDGQAVIRQESTLFTSIQFLDRVTGTGAGTGLTITAKYSTNPGSEVRALRLVAFDLDVNNTAFPQNSTNGWLWSQNDSNVALTLTRTPHTTITFTPDGDSDYLVLGAGCLVTMNNTYGYAGVGIDGSGPLAYRFHQPAGTERYNYFNMYVLKKPSRAPTNVTFDAYAAGGPSGVIRHSRLLILRLKTFVKQVGTLVGSPTVTPGTSWQQVATAAPLPTPEAGDQFLVFSRVQAYNWSSTSHEISKRVLRGTTVLDTQRMSNISSAGDNYGPTNAYLDTAVGTDSYSMEVKRETDAGSPVNFFYAALIAVSTELQYVATTKKYLPMFSTSTSAAVGVPAAPTWTTYATLPGNKFVSGHRYLVLATFLHGNINNGSEQSRARLTFNGSLITGCLNYESHTTIHSQYTPFSMMCRVVGTGSGVGVEFQGQSFGSSNTQLRSIFLTAIDLDGDNALFPPDSDMGWKSVTNLVQFSNSTYPTWTTACSLSLTPDGTSDYLIIGDATLYESGIVSGEGWAQLLKDGSPLYSNPPYFTIDSTAPAETYTHIPVAWLLTAPPATTMTLELQTAKRLGGYTYTHAARLVVLRLNNFAKRGQQFLTAGSHQNPYSDTWDPIGPVATPSPVIEEIGERFWLFTAWQAQWLGTYEMDFRLYDPATAAVQMSQTNNYYSNNQGDYKNMLLSLPVTAQALGSYWRPEDRNPTGVGNCLAETSRLMLALSSQLLELYEDASADGGIALVGSAVSAKTSHPSASGAIAVQGAVSPERLRSTLGSGSVLVTGTAGAERLLTPNATGSVQLLGTAHAFFADWHHLPSVARSFADHGRELRPADLASTGLTGNDALGVRNRLVIVSNSRLGIDPTYGTPYSFEGPPSVSPLRLGFKRGDLIYLFQAQGQAAGPNTGKILTILDPSTLEVMEVLVHPDTTVYKFYAVKRGI